ncbi:hypothetical protein BGZ80_009008 [Entomortierella chlamydospora]|uniref:Mediator complex subunit 18 n=1 Tax=Entomortierella chlamydospora TaxID=101097 RepID=A0A9P6T415_9FUNG|nr:hypothetical protein BGZ80_009008 [Entomortierella chlamydospora]
MSVSGSTSGGASFECSLTGTVIPGQFRHLYDRLLGLCEHAAHSKMFEHEMLFTPADPRKTVRAYLVNDVLSHQHSFTLCPVVQRPIYAARNDDVHLRLRAKMMVLDQSKKTQHGERSGEDNQRKRMKNDGDGNSIIINGGQSEDTEMTYSAQEIETKAQQQLLEGGAGGVSSIEQGLSNGSSKYGSKRVVIRQHQLCQYGHPEPGRTIVVRSAILVKIHGDAFGFLSLLGYG